MSNYITKEIFKNLKKGDWINTIMTSREIISVGRNCVKLRKIHTPMDKGEVTVYYYSDLKTSICSVERLFPAQKCRIRITFNKYNLESKQILKNSHE